MRAFPLHCRTIQVLSASGELRQIPVSGITKARLLWLFRNFSILDFPVLTATQKQLVARVWYASTGAGVSGAYLDLIGSIEGFSPRLFEAPRPSPAPRKKSTQSTDSRGSTRGLLPPTISWSSIAVLLLVCAVFLRPIFFGTRASAPRPAVPASHPTPQARAAAPRLAERQPVEAAPQPRTPPASAPSAAPVSQTAAAPAAPLPEAMARQESDVIVRHLQPPAALASRAHAEVLVRVQVDSHGRPLTFDIVRGDRSKGAAAMAAARRWSYRPCFGPGACEHTVRFIDYGDASSLQVIR